MRFHSQNLKKEDGEKGLISWRCWLDITEKVSINFSIKVPSSFWHIYVTLGGRDEALGFSIGTPLCAMWIHLDWFRLQKWIENKVKRKDEKYGSGRTIGVSFHDGAFYFDLWRDPMNWKSIDPKWWSFTFDPIRFLFGKEVHSKKIHLVKLIKLDLPEGIYDATVTLFTSYWKRPRWPWPAKIHRATVDVPVGIPMQGKGENSYDIGMDAVFASTFPVRENESSYQIGKRFVIHCLKDRQKYGRLSDEGYAKWKTEGEIRLVKQGEALGIVGAKELGEKLVREANKDELDKLN